MTASLERRTFGRTGLEVTALGYGAMEIRGPRIWRGRDLTDDQADRILNAVLDAGINFIDTGQAPQSSAVSLIEIWSGGAG